MSLISMPLTVSPGTRIVSFRFSPSRKRSNRSRTDTLRMHPAALMRISGFEIVFYDDSPSAEITEIRNGARDRGLTSLSLAPIGPSTTPIGCRRVAVSHSILLFDLLGDLEYLCVPVGVLFDLHVLPGFEYPVNLADHVSIFCWHHDLPCRLYLVTALRNAFGHSGIPFVFFNLSTASIRQRFTDTSGWASALSHSDPERSAIVRAGKPDK